MEPKRIYIRNLPHLQLEDGVFSLVFRLNGSLPAQVIIQLQEERAQFQRETIQKPEKSKIISSLAEERTSYFEKFDLLLHHVQPCPFGHLQNTKGIV